MKNKDNVIETTKIYLVTNCYGNPNKAYVGKTKGNWRKHKHKQVFGNQINYVIIDEIQSIERKDWRPLEEYWIKYYRDLGYDLQNKNNGGGGSNGDKIRGLKRSEETRRKISQNSKGISRNKGRKFSEESILRKNSKLKGMKRTEDQINNMRKPKPEGFKEKLSMALKGKPKPNGWRKNIQHGN